jgi:hypothetical protein
MPKPTFVSKEFFVDASEFEAKSKILNIPRFISNIKFVTENTMMQSLKFIYQRSAEDRDNFIKVSLLPLNNSSTKITLQASYTNGCAFGKDNYIRSAISNFESAIRAAINNKIEDFKTQEPKPAVNRFFNLIGA